MKISAPILDHRDAEEFYQQALTLAQAYCPQWTEYWPAEPDPTQDVGLVLLKLFSVLAKYTADMENLVPEQRRLAFFQFMNMQLRPPLAANAPLCFTLAADRAPRLIPANTAVLNAIDQKIRFQTDQDLLVVPADLSAAFTIMPAQDLFINALPGLLAEPDSGLSVPLFVADQAVDPGEQPLGHWFLFGDDQLFKPTPSLQNLTINLSGAQLYPEYFGQWFDGAFNPLPVELIADISGQYTTLQIRFKALPTAAAVSLTQLQQQLFAIDGRQSGFDAPPQTETDDQPAFWLLVKPDPQVKVQAALSRQLPVITGMQCIFGGDAIAAQQAAFNQVLLDVTNGAYPFGESPQKDDAFYIRSDTVFAKQGALVTLSFALTAVARTFPVVLYWQYWDGKQWVSLNQNSTDISRYQFIDTTDQLRQDNPAGPTIISFQCPAMSLHTVAGAEGLWLRSVIADGGYGQIGGFVTTPVDQTIAAIPDQILPAQEKPGVIAYLNNTAGVNFSYKFDPGNYYPPYIQSLQIGYSFSSLPNRFWSYNAFALSRFLFSPYKPVDETTTGFYFAFAPASFGQYSTGQKLCLYFYLEQESAKAAGQLQWQYFDGLQWQTLEVDDGSYGLSRSGVVGMTAPATMPEAYLFSQSAFWFRVNNPHVTHTVRIFGMYPNAVMARNATSVDNDVLGSGNEAPNQTVTLSAAPVLDGLSLGVYEPVGFLPDGAIDDDWLASAADTTVANTSATTGQSDSGIVFRAWQQVDNFAFSGPADRVFTLDPQNGLVSFGNGRNGMPPPPGHDNIVAVHYEQTQGLRGNVGRNALTLLKPGISDIASVTNPAPAMGGVNGDTRNDLNRSSPALVRAGGHAVDLDDLTALAAAGSQEIARACAIETPLQRIQITVLPVSNDPVPYASPVLLQQVGAYMRKQCLAPLAARILIQAPDYVPISVVAQISVNAPVDQKQALQASISQRLAQFFQPVSGGTDGRGWNFGDTVRASSVNLFLGTLPLVTAVLSLTLNGHENGNIALLPTQLPVAGDMSIYLYTE